MAKVKIKSSLINKKCSICGKYFSCGVATTESSCWCNDLPEIIPMQISQDCLCSDCLVTTIKDRIDQSIEQHSLNEILLIAKKYQADKKLVEKIDYNIEDGNYVFTRWYHLKRGTCCKNGCRHCPYPKKN